MEYFCWSLCQGMRLWMQTTTSVFWRDSKTGFVTREQGCGLVDAMAKLTEISSSIRTTLLLMFVPKLSDSLGKTTSTFCHTLSTHRTWHRVITLSFHSSKRRCVVGDSQTWRLPRTKWDPSSRTRWHQKCSPYPWSSWPTGGRNVLPWKGNTLKVVMLLWNHLPKQRTRRQNLLTLTLTLIDISRRRSAWCGRENVTDSILWPIGTVSSTFTKGNKHCSTSGK